MVMGAATWFQIIRFETIMFGALALIVMLAITSTRKR